MSYMEPQKIKLTGYLNPFDEEDGIWKRADFLVHSKTFCFINDDYELLHTFISSFIEKETKYYKRKEFKYSVHEELGFILNISTLDDGFKYDKLMIDQSLIPDFVISWLLEQDYGEGPDTDGHAEKGYMFYTGQYGEVYTYGNIFGIKPRWIVYGK